MPDDAMSGLRQGLSEGGLRRIADAMLARLGKSSRESAICELKGSLGAYVDDKDLIAGYVDAYRTGSEPKIR